MRGLFLFALPSERYEEHIEREKILLWKLHQWLQIEPNRSTYINHMSILCCFQLLKHLFSSRKWKQKILEIRVFIFFKRCFRLFYIVTMFIIGLRGVRPLPVRTSKAPVSSYEEIKRKLHKLQTRWRVSAMLCYSDQVTSQDSTRQLLHMLSHRLY